MYNFECFLLQLENWIVDNIEIIAGAAVGIAVIQLVCILFACYFQKDLYG